MERERETTTGLRRSLDGALCALMFLLPVKFGGLVILPVWPANFYEWWLASWPVQIGMGAVWLWAVAGLIAGWRDRRVKPDLWLGVVVAWVLVQWVSALGSLWPERARPVALFLTTGALFFMAGWWPGRGERFRACLGALAAAMWIVCAVGLQQHFVTFQQTLQDAERYAADLPAEMRARMADITGKLRQGRIFSTLFYPNSLAGFLILAGPPAVCWVWLWLGSKLKAQSSKVVGTAMFGALMLWCLLLTRSKGGFVMLAAAVAGGFLLCPVVRPRWRVGALAGLLVLGAVFYGAAGARRGMETLEARGDYWKAGATMIAETPWLGGGPGTFGIRYIQHHQPGAEWTRLAHNNFLQMWTDSGVVGFACYTLLWGGALWAGARRLRRQFDPMTWAVWVGLAAWTAHNLVDFDLYVAGIAWPAFFMAGWMVRGGEE